MQVIVNDLLTQYDSQGKGKLVLLLHGWGDRRQTFQQLSDALAQQYQVVALDLPGFGETQVPKEVWNLDNYAQFVAAFLQKLELPQPYAVLGHSNGGALAVRAVSLGTLQPEKLVLVAASGVRTTQKFKRFFVKLLAKVGNIATLWMPERYRSGLRKSLYSAAGSDMLVVPELEETFKQTVRQDTQKDAAQITTPTLLVYAENDDAVPVQDGQRYNQLIKGSRLEVVAGAGHFVHHDQPEQVGKLVQEFLA